MTYENQRRWRTDLTTRPVDLDVCYRNPSPNDCEPLGSLMLAAYRGTIDERHRSLAEAVAHVAKYFAGEFGSPLLDCSFVALEDARPISVTLVSMLEGAPHLAQVYTAPERQNHGVAGALIQLSMKELAAKGVPAVGLVVTVGNAPAEHLYQKLGFEPLEEEG